MIHLTKPEISISPISNLYLKLDREESRARRQRRTTLANTIRLARTTMAQQRLILATIYGRAKNNNLTNITNLIEPVLQTSSSIETPSISLAEFAAAIDSAATWECEAKEWEDKYLKLLKDSGGPL
jgi:hypothetical protein